jgi:serine protease Do
MQIAQFRKPLVLTVISAALVSAGAYIGARSSPGAIAATPEAAAVLSDASLAQPRALALPSFADLVAANGPAVVNIAVSQKVQPTAFEDSPLAPFFGNTPREPGGHIVRGQGSGFIISADGVILTNAHVVDGASTVTVKLTDRREFRAKVIGVDKRTDVAVVKIDGANLPVVKVGNPAGTRIGDWVVAIGSPFGFENSVTSGIVSAKGRSLPSENYVPFIQTDVPINPGNSGGPLFNLNGEVIGINSQIFSESGGYMGISFSIPIDMAMKVSQQLLASGRVTRGVLGAVVQDVSGPLAKTLKLPQASGAVVVSVEPGSPAEKAGMEPGDVVRSFEGQKIDNSIDLPRVVGDARPGTQARIEVWRDGKAVSLVAKIGELHDAKPRIANDEGGRLGLAVRPLTREEQREVHANGLLVEDVSGAAEQAGLQPGDIVLMANGKPVQSVRDLRNIVSNAEGGVALLVQRDNARTFIPVPLS